MEHTRFIGWDIHKERISVAVAESGRSGAVEYLGEIANEPGAVSKLCGRLGRWRFVMRPDRVATAFIANSQASAIGATWWRRR
jgi:hypothetical protein